MSIYTHKVNYYETDKMGIGIYSKASYEIIAGFVMKDARKMWNYSESSVDISPFFWSWSR